MELQVLPEPNYPVNPDQFVGRKTHSEAFTLALQQGLAAGRISSFAVLGDWGIGKSSLLLKFAAICSDPKYGILPVLVPVWTDYGDYRRFAESLLDGLAEALAATSSLTTRLHAEVRNWKLKRVSMGGFTLDREAQRFFLSSGSTLLRHALGEAWKRFFLPAQISGAMFFLDDLDNFATPVAQDVARTLRDQFQWLGINRMNYSVCFSARSDYFSAIRSFAEPAVRSTPSFILCLSRRKKPPNTQRQPSGHTKSCTVFHVGFTRKPWGIPISSPSSVESYWPALRVLYPKVLSTSGPMSFSSWKETNSD